MSRARPYDDPITGTRTWFDQKGRATAAHLELLADIEGIPIDDLLDEGLTQKQILYRLREVDGIIPAHVIEHRRKRQLEAGREPACRICSLNGWECEGRITRHHFIPRWLMLELENYQSYAARSVCTIPICVGRHRDLHYRKDGTAKTIVPYLRDHERLFAQKMLDELREQHPQIFDLMEGRAFIGDDSYVAQLIDDYRNGLFSSSENAYALPEFDVIQAEATG